ncbi:hypothetical protein FRX31_015351 [Thalictrum thalictroides]|uniref:Uncharacterized protein n=1 Tax=Thalictrum thalictroides TaxID=46969 RepID=A0A7J6WG41_THATH|nr:hypothetical protein FRX31_015351 [Thalictrum thalictroides]
MYHDQKVQHYNGCQAQGIYVVASPHQFNGCQARGIYLDGLTSPVQRLPGSGYYLGSLTSCPFKAWLMVGIQYPLKFF